MDIERKMVLGAIVMFMVCVVMGPCIYRSTEDSATITVDDKERVAGGNSSKYLVWTTQGEVFQVADSASYMSCNASDRYGRLKPGKTYKCKVAGWRWGCASMYRTIIEAEEVK